MTLDRDAPFDEIHLKFSQVRDPCIFTKPIHISQQLIKTYKDGSVLLRLPLKINKELWVILLGFGSEGQVIKPASLKNEILAIAQNIVSKYH